MASFLNSVAFRNIFSAVAAAAVAVKSFTPSYTIAGRIADHVIEVAVLFGVYSSSARTVNK